MEDQSFFHSLAMGIKTITRRFGVDLVKYDLRYSESKLLEHIIRQYNINTILDVGANIGQYSVDALKNGFKGKVYSFEPIPSVYKTLAKTAEKYSDWQVFNLGVGSKENEI